MGANTGSLRFKVPSLRSETLVGGEKLRPESLANVLASENAKVSLKSESLAANAASARFQLRFLLRSETLARDLKV